MSDTRGIFESFPNQPETRKDSPFSVAPESGNQVASSPFTAVARQDSPFTVIDEVGESNPPESGRPARLPERKKSDTPFQVAEPSEGFGYEAPAKPFSADPFGTPSSSAPSAASPFSAAPQQAAASPFSVEPQRGASPSTQAAIAAFGNWQETPVTPAPQASAEPAFAKATPTAFAPAPISETPAASMQVPAAFSPAAPVESSDASQSDSYSIRQLELRAIFGVDREMNVEEILQRTRALPGMRNIARVSSQDMVSIEALKSLLPNLGFGSGGLKLYSGSVPLEFIREGSVMLAVQTDGGFAPGVRETLMLVARELGRIS